MSNDLQENFKRKKKQYFKQKFSNKKQRITNGSKNETSISLQDNLTGFLVTCNSKEYQCLQEAYNILNEAADKLYGPYDNNNSSSVSNDNVMSESKQDISDPDDIDACIAKEIELLKNPKQRRFIQVKTKCKNLLFIRSNDQQVEPSQMMEQILSDIKANVEQNTRFIQRIIPVHGTFKADSDKLGDNFESLFDKFAGKQATTFAVQCRVRNNSSLNGEKILLQQIATIIRSKRLNWVVNLNEPNISVFVNVVQKAVCVSFVRDYNQYAKYNLIEFYRKCLKSNANDNTTDDNSVITNEDKNHIESEITNTNLDAKTKGEIICENSASESGSKAIEIKPEMEESVESDQKSETEFKECQDKTELIS